MNTYSHAKQVLTRREEEVLALLAKGLLYKEICDSLDICLPTVRTHISHIYEKLQVRSRTEATLKSPIQARLVFSFHCRTKDRHAPERLALKEKLQQLKSADSDPRVVVKADDDTGR